METKKLEKEKETLREEFENELIEGRNAVIEALRAGRAIDKIFIARGDVDKTLGHIASKARDKGIVVVEADRRKLDFMSRTKAHQGVVALAAVREYWSSSATRSATRTISAPSSARRSASGPTAS